MEGKEFKPVPTRAQLVLQKQNKSADFQTIVFEMPKSTRKTRLDEVAPHHEFAKTKPFKDDPQSAVKKSKSIDDTEFDIKKARHEVLNFAMANQRVTKNKKKMEIFQLVKLGAIPPKKANKNYKDLLDERKRLKLIRENRKKFHQLGKNQAGAASVKCRSKSKLEKQKKVRAPVTGIDQNYGVVKPKFNKCAGYKKKK